VLGGSLEYPETARALEVGFNTRIGDTVARADFGIATGLAIKVRSPKTLPLQ